MANTVFYESKNIIVRRIRRRDKTIQYGLARPGDKSVFDVGSNLLRMLFIALYVDTNGKGSYESKIRHQARDFADTCLETEKDYGRLLLGLISMRDRQQQRSDIWIHEVRIRKELNLEQ